MVRKSAALAALSAALTFGAAGGAAAGDVSVHGSMAVADTLMRPWETKIEHRSGEGVTIVANGSGDGIRDLLAGRADVAMISSPLPALVATLNQEEPGSVDGSRLVPHMVSVSRVAFIVHYSNPVAELTSQQLTEIFAGRITNWSDLDGRDMPIEIVTTARGGGIRAEVERSLLYGGMISGNVTVVDGGSREVTDVVGNNRGAIGLAQEGGLHDSIAQIATDRAVQTPMILVTLGQPSPAVVKVIEATRSAMFSN